jgi:flavin-dependent dehydrogenase
VIVGGGPAGLSAAKSVAIQGLDIILLKKVPKLIIQLILLMGVR